MKDLKYFDPTVKNAVDITGTHMLIWNGYILLSMPVCLGASHQLLVRNKG